VNVFHGGEEPLREGEDCCPPGSLPLNDAQYLGATAVLRGEVSKIHEDVRIYSVGPSNDETPIRGVVILAHDIFGFDTARTHNVCDDLTEGGFYVIAPDFFGEDLSVLHGWCSGPENARRAVGRLRYPWKKVQPKLDMVLDHIKSSTPYGDLKVGMLGFCWGAWCIFHASSSERIACGASFHPSLNYNALKMIHGDDLEELCDEVKCPQLLMPTFPDPACVREGGVVIETLRKKSFGERCELVDFRHVTHGFANRGNLGNKRVRQAYQAGMWKVKEFFSKNL